ncbi:MAG TPA: recombinase RarA [Firmicutes bacterium]|nr:recombinase RarA [Bacillota bacterium]
MEILANTSRPKTLDEIIGQSHLVGPDGILKNLLANKKLFSMILWGKPGTGKTTIATVLVNELGLPYRMLNATINNKADFDIVIEEAKMQGGLVLIMDEIHRMNKDKQDLLLPYVENGLITLIGLTTSNPYYSINPAIRSRVQIFELKDLTTEEMVKGLKNVANTLEDISIDEESLNYIANLSSGDMRNAINKLEMSYYIAPKHKIDLEVLKSIEDKPVLYTDKNGNGHYELLSAFQKSIRGSDVDAAIYYLALLLEIGDLDSIFRRMTVIAYEDIGLANPGLGPKVHAAIEAVKMIGIDEGRIPLSTVVIEMALSPKSNSAYLAIDAALNDIRKGDIGDIPEVIKGHSKNYRYPHDYPPNYWVDEQYLPEKLKNRKYYTPKNNTYEKNLDRLDKERRNKR